jgi:hypothetical protein
LFCGILFLSVAAPEWLHPLISKSADQRTDAGSRRKLKNMRDLNFVFFKGIVSL